MASAQVLLVEGVGAFGDVRPWTDEPLYELGTALVRQRREGPQAVDRGFEGVGPRPVSSRGEAIELGQVLAVLVVEWWHEVDSVREVAMATGELDCLALAFEQLPRSVAQKVEHERLPETADHRVEVVLPHIPSIGEAIVVEVDRPSSENDDRHAVDLLVDEQLERVHHPAGTWRTVRRHAHETISRSDSSRSLMTAG